MPGEAPNGFASRGPKREVIQGVGATGVSAVTGSGVSAERFGPYLSSGKLQGFQ